MAKPRSPVTGAIRALRAAGVEYTEHLYRYEQGSGAVGAAATLGLDPYTVIKTLVMETDAAEPLVVLMHGDRTVSTKRLARIIGTKTVRPCDPATAHDHSGYVVGGTSPFGLRTRLPIYMEETIPPLERMYVNGGSRGFLLGMSPGDVVATLSPRLVGVAVA